MAARSFGEKLEMLEALRARVEPIRRAKATRESSTESLTAQNQDDLVRAFQVLGMQVGPRRGPSRRTKEEREWYCLRRHLLALAADELLNYPVRIYKSEAPDFIVCDSIRGIFGIEVTEATEDDWQRELSETDDGGGPAAAIPVDTDGFAGDRPETDWSVAVINAVEMKLPKLTRFETGICDLLIYVNSRMSGVANMKGATVALLTAVAPKGRTWAACGRLGRIHVLADSQLVYDLLGEPRLLKAT